MDNCHLDDDQMPSGEFIAVEEAENGHRQSLWVRVGPVYYGEEKDPDPRVWICYQEEHMGGPLAGPVMLTPEVWRELVKAVEWRLKKKMRKRWRIPRHGVRRRT